MGTTVEIDGILEGERVTIVIPAGCQYAQQVSVSNYGMPIQGTLSRGKLIAAVEVIVPTDLTKAQLLDLSRIVAERSLSKNLFGGADTDGGDEGDAWHPFGQRHGKGKRGKGKRS